jgi:hypothetical protein
MYNFHKIRTEQDVQEQYFINESLNKFKTFEEVKNFKRKEKNRQKCLFFKDEDSKIKYTILPNKKGENFQNKEENLDLKENDEKNIDNFQEIISSGKLNKDIKDKIMIFLLNKSKANYEKDKEILNKLNEIKEKKDEVNEQINNINNEIENQNAHLKKIKSLYFVLVSLLMRKNNFPIEKNGENKINVVNNEINKNKNPNIKLFNFINRYADYIGHKNLIVFTRTLKRNKLNLIQKNNSLNFQSLSNIVQKGETFSIPNDKFNFDDYLNNLEVISFKSRKSNRFNDSFSFSAEDKNLNSSFSMIGGNNLFNMDFENEIFNPNKNILGDDNTF